MRSMIFAILALVCLTIPADACHGGGSGRQQRGRLLFRGRQRNAQQAAYVQQGGYQTTVRTSSWSSGTAVPVQTAPAPVRVTPVLP